VRHSCHDLMYGSADLPQNRTEEPKCLRLYVKRQWRVTIAPKGRGFG
jgi:hypothetical protein